MVHNSNRADLFYEYNGELLSLPKWGQFYISLGQYIDKTISSSSNRTIVGLTVPSRNFCAPLITLGFIGDRIELSERTGDLEHIEYIKNLPFDTPVTFRSEFGKRFRGVYKGYVERGQELYFKLKTDKKTDRFVPVIDSRKIELLDKKEIKLWKNQTGRTIKQCSDFSLDLIGDQNAFSLTMYSKFEVVIIGSKKIIEKEIADQEFFTGNHKKGCLADVIRIKEYQGKFSAYRSRVISNRIKRTKLHTIEDPPLAIFDGSLSFLKWRPFWMKSNWVVILDRTDSQYDSSLEQLNRIYIQYHLANSAKIELPNIPDGVEITIFEVK